MSDQCVVAPYRISISGHRPGDLRTAEGRPIPLMPLMPQLFARASARATALGTRTIEVITGGALGVDQEVAEAVHHVRAGDADYRWRSVIVLPFPIDVMAARWPAADRERLERLCAEADELIGPVSPAFAQWAYHARNKIMVDRSIALVAFWSGKRSGGTFAAIRYALTAAKPPRPVYNALAGFAPVHERDLAA